MAESSSHAQCLASCKIDVCRSILFSWFASRDSPPLNRAASWTRHVSRYVLCIIPDCVFRELFKLLEEVGRPESGPQIHRMRPSGGLCCDSEVRVETARPILERVWRARLERVLQTVYLCLFHRRGDLRCSSHLREGEPSQRHCRSPALFLSFPSFSLSTTQRILHDRVGECRLWWDDCTAVNCGGITVLHCVSLSIVVGRCGYGGGGGVLAAACHKSNL